MRYLDHPNVVSLKHCFFSTTEKDELYLNLVLEYVPETVHRVIKHYNKMNQRMPMIYVKLYSYQVCITLDHPHYFSFNLHVCALFCSISFIVLQTWNNKASFFFYMWVFLISQFSLVWCVLVRECVSCIYATRIYHLWYPFYFLSSY